MSNRRLALPMLLALSACQPGRPVAALPPVELMTCAGLASVFVRHLRSPLDPEPLGCEAKRDGQRVI